MVALYAAYVLIFGATFSLFFMLFREEVSRAAEENLEELRGRKASDLLVRVTRPFFSQYVVPLIRGRPFWDSRRIEIRRKIIAAGLREELTPDEFIAYKFFLILFFPVVLGVLHAMDFIDISPWMIAFSGVAGWFYPNFWTSQRIKARHTKIRNAMPFIVDLLALSTEAGLDFIGAIQKVVEKAVPSPLVEELEQVLKEIKVGSSRQEALREMSKRIDMTEVNSFVAILISADQMGAPIGRTLRQQSEQIRTERFLRAEKAGALAAQKLMIPTILCIVPCVFIMIGGPLALTFLVPDAQ